MSKSRAKPKPNEIEQAPPPANSANISATEHLRPYQFKPGVSGNPSGRPKGIFRDTALKHLLKRAKDGETLLDQLIEAQVAKAIRKRDTRAAEYLRDTVDGRPTVSDTSLDLGINISISWAGQDVPAWARPPQHTETARAEEPHLIQTPNPRL